MTVRVRARMSARGLQDPRRTQTRRGIKEGFSEEETSELGRTEEEESQDGISNSELRIHSDPEASGTAQYDSMQ